MELIKSLAIGVGIGVVVGLILVPIDRWFWRRRAQRARPDSGTRPEVRLVVGELIFDMTDTLIRVPDSDGQAVWVVLGPEHVRMTLADRPRVEIAQPLPMNTDVVLSVVRSDHGEVRFCTREEIDRKHGVR